MLPDPVAQGLLDHSQTACCCRLALARLNKPCRLLLELKRVTSPFRLRHLRYPFALEQLAKGYVLRGQGQGSRRNEFSFHHQVSALRLSGGQLPASVPFSGHWFEARIRRYGLQMKARKDRGCITPMRSISVGFSRNQTYRLSAGNRLAPFANSILRSLNLSAMEDAGRMNQSWVLT
jgi:hypothetical protein